MVEDNTMGYFQFPKFELVPIKAEELTDVQHTYSLNELLEEIKQYPYNEFYFSSFL